MLTKFFLIIELCAGIVCGPMPDKTPYDTILQCQESAEVQIAYIKSTPEAYRSVVNGAPGEIRAPMYICGRRLG